MTALAERLAAYRLQVRETFGRMSDQALAFQSARIVGGIDREECDREILRRAKGAGEGREAVSGYIIYATTSNEAQAAWIAGKLLDQGRDATTANVADLIAEGYPVRTQHTFAVLAEPIEKGAGWIR